MVLSGRVPNIVNIGALFGGCKIWLAVRLNSDRGYELSDRLMKKGDWQQQAKWWVAYFFTPFIVNFRVDFVVYFKVLCYSDFFLIFNPVLEVGDTKIGNWDFLRSLKINRSSLCDLVYECAFLSEFWAEWIDLWFQ